MTPPDPTQPFATAHENGGIGWFAEVPPRGAERLHRAHPCRLRHVGSFAKADTDSRVYSENEST